MRLLQRGYTNGQIAESLGITLDGAKFHVGEIIQKLGATSREEAVILWAERPRRLWPSLGGGAALKWAGIGAAVIAGTVGLAVWAALLRSGEETEDPAGASRGAQDNSPVAAQPAAPTLVAAQPDLAECPTPSTVTGPPNASVDWVDFVRFEGVEYLGRGFGGAGATIDVSRLGEPFGRVEVNVSDTAVDPWKPRQDCEAAFLPAGEILYRIVGYDPRFRIATSEGRVYEAYGAARDGLARDFLDLDGKVATITVSDDVTGQEWVIDDGQTVERMTTMLLESPFSTALVGSRGRQLFLWFYLKDATSWRRAFYPEIGTVWPGIKVPDAFVQTVLAAIQP